MLRRDRAQMEEHASVPAAGQIWWRSAVRARMEAAQAAARPVSWAQGMTAATLFGVVCAALVLTWPSLRRVSGLAGGRLLDGLDSNVQTLGSRKSGRGKPLPCIAIAYKERFAQCNAVQKSENLQRKAKNRTQQQRDAEVIAQACPTCR